MKTRDSVQAIIINHCTFMAPAFHFYFKLLGAKLYLRHFLEKMHTNGELCYLKIWWHTHNLCMSSCSHPGEKYLITTGNIWGAHHVPRVRGKFFAWTWSFFLYRPVITPLEGHLPAFTIYWSTRFRSCCYGLGVACPLGVHGIEAWLSASQLGPSRGL